MSLIVFPKRGSCTSPQHEPASAHVNVTAIQRDAARDMFNEALIRVLGNAWKGAFVAHNPAAERMYWDAYTDAVKRRSEAQVARMERARGLR
jgi:hypothetical protein